MSAPKLTPETHFAGRQCLGKRSEQEDAYAFSEISTGEGAPSGLLIVLADGMGGHSAGHEASDLAVGAFVSAFLRKSSELPARLTAALHAANTAISDAIKASPKTLEGIGVDQCRGLASLSSPGRAVAPDQRRSFLPPHPA